MKKFSFCLAAAALCALLLAACSSAAPSSSAGNAALSGAPTGDISAPAGQAEPEPAPSSTASVASSFASTPAATEYGSGTWVVEATKEGDIPSLERLEFQDGELVYHYFSSSEIGKGSYGRDGSDELEYSPYYQKTAEEAMALLEEAGYTVTIQQA